MWDFDENTTAVIQLGLSMLSEGHFMSAHERFEDAWRSAEGRERTLFHALAQLAASYQQLAQGRARASVRTWEKACAKLESISALPSAFRSEVETFFQRLHVNNEGPRFIDAQCLPPVAEWPCPK